MCSSDLVDAALAIHGDKSQGNRERSLEGFRKGRIRVLVATDIAARGIDIDDISHVVNYEIPNVPETYVHRIGRTARAGASGTAISLCAPEERDSLRDIERLIRHPIPVVGAEACASASEPRGHRSRPQRGPAGKERPESHPGRRGPGRSRGGDGGAHRARVRNPERHETPSRNSAAGVDAPPAPAESERILATFGAGV